MNGYILTASGAKVSISAGMPTLRDIAQSLSRIPRFAGHGRSPWSVLDHTLFCYDLAKQLPQERAYPALALAMLLHDAHESVTSDIPTPVKSLDMKQTQWALDIRLMDRYFPGGFTMYDCLHAQVKNIDRRALLAEALMVGPEACWSRSAVIEHFGDVPLDRDVDTWYRPSFVHRYGAPEVARRAKVEYFLALVKDEHELVLDAMDF